MDRDFSFFLMGLILKDGSRTILPNARMELTIVVTIHTVESLGTIIFMVWGRKSDRLIFSKGAI